MNNKIATGIWLVFIGGILLLYNMDVLNFNFYALIKLWPLAIVSVGISLLLQNRPHGVLISTVCNVLICAFLLYKGVSESATLTDETALSVTKANQHVAVDHLETDETVELHVQGGAATFQLLAPKESGKLIEAWTDDPHVVLNLHTGGDHPRRITFDSKIKNNQSKKSTIFYQLSDKPVWKMALNVGAVSFKGDLSAYKLSSLEVNAGASSIAFTLGHPAEQQTDIQINTGASNIDLSIPKSVAYEVVSKNVLSSTRYEGATQIKKGHYQTPGYREAAHKYRILLNGAANSFSINTYSSENG